MVLNWDFVRIVHDGTPESIIMLPALKVALSSEHICYHGDITEISETAVDVTITQLESEESPAAVIVLASYKVGEQSINSVCG